MKRLEVPVTIVLKRELKSLNALAKRHWGTRNQERRDWTTEIQAELRLLSVKPPSGRRKVTITRILGPRQRLLDFDNLVGGAKPLIDAGTQLGLWRDDDPAWLDREYRQDDTRRSDGPAVELTIEEAA